jgi:predicted esterase
MDDNHRMRVESIETPTHGRVLIREGATRSAVVLGFHGYSENAEIQMERLAGLPGADAWTLISVQGLHRFYRGRSQDVAASWMTRQDREEMIRDNVEYVGRIVQRFVPNDVAFFTMGFSQGVATAFRGGLRGRRQASAIIGVGGDVPPELLSDASGTFPPVLLTRGERDEWYTAATLESDVDALRRRRSPVETLVYRGGHEWSDEVSRAASAFITAHASASHDNPTD